jgi:hypothetical protein
MATRRKAARPLPRSDSKALQNQLKRKYLSFEGVESEPYAAFSYLNGLKSQGRPLPRVDYFRALCFLKRGEPEAAIEALKEELRYFPRHAASRSLLRLLMSEVRPSIAVAASDREFEGLFEKVQPYTMLGRARLFALYQLAKGACIAGIPGNFVECGVAAGGSSALMAATIAAHSDRPRELFCCDTFEGMPAPGVNDTLRGRAAADTGWGQGTCSAREASLIKACKDVGASGIAIAIRGLYRKTLPTHINRIGPIAMLHIDADWYQSTHEILENLYDHVVAGGFIQIDDFHYWEGCHKAVREFARSRGIRFKLNPIDGIAVWMQKRRA